MSYSERENQEYEKFIFELGKKTREIAEDYKNLSETNKHRVEKYVNEIILYNLLNKLSVK